MKKSKAGWGERAVGLRGGHVAVVARVFWAGNLKVEAWKKPGRKSCHGQGRKTKGTVKCEDPEVGMNLALRNSQEAVMLVQSL